MPTSDIKKGPLYVDSTNNRVGIGTASPTQLVDIAHSGSQVAGAVRIGDPSSISSNTGIYMRTTGLATIGAAGGTIVFDTNFGSSEKVRIDPDGLKFNGDTAAANALDDYEEGNWTPVFSNAGTPSYATQFGRYTKIGRVVYCTVAIYATGVSSGSTINLDGLPFSSADTGDASQRSTIRIANSGHLNGLSEHTGRFRINGSTMQGVKSDSQTTYMTASQMTTSGTIQFSTDFWYYTS